MSYQGLSELFERDSPEVVLNQVRDRFIRGFADRLSVARQLVASLPGPGRGASRDLLQGFAHRLAGLSAPSGLRVLAPRRRRWKR